MAEFKALETWAADMLAKLQPAQQRRLMVDMARRLRTANSQRMRAQTDPEGQAWEPRKKPAQALRGKREQLRQATTRDELLQAFARCRVIAAEVGVAHVTTIEMRFMDMLPEEG